MLQSWLCCHNALGFVRTVHQIPQADALRIWLPVSHAPSCIHCIVTTNPSKTGLKPLNLTHWGQVMHICISKLTIIGSWSDNSLSSGGLQAIIWTNVGILLIRTLEMNFSEIFGDIKTFSFNKMHLKMSSAELQQFCLSLNVLREIWIKYKKCFSNYIHLKILSAECWPFCSDLNESMNPGWSNIFITHPRVTWSRGRRPTPSGVPKDMLVDLDGPLWPLRTSRSWTWWLGQRGGCSWTGR